MAAALSGIMHAPLTGIFLIAEITGGYILMVPLMIASAISYFVSRSSNKYSIYTKSLADSGTLLSHEDKDSTVLNMMKLRYLVEIDFVALSEDDYISEKLNEILKTKRNLFPVINAEGEFKGLLYMDDILRITSTDGGAQMVKELMQAAPAVVLINDSLKSVLGKMESENLWILPVLNEAGKYAGFISKTTIFNKYRDLLRRQADYMK